MPGYLFFGRRCFGRRGEVGHVRAAYPQQEGLPTAHQTPTPILTDDGFHLVATSFQTSLEPLRKLLTVNAGINLLVFAGLDLEMG